MNVVTAAEMRAIDAQAINEFKIPGMVLMENAGIRLAERIRKMTREKNRHCGRRGNNGGDGFVAARHLYREKRLPFGPLSRTTNTGDALANLKIIRKLDIGFLPAGRRSLCRL